MEVIRKVSVDQFEWSIRDESFERVVAGEFFGDADTVRFSLEEGRRYFFETSAGGYTTADSLLSVLVMDGEPIIWITGHADPGDHLYPFRTGRKPGQLKIVGGEDANIADFPWQVFFRTGDYMCGGSIISESWVITAAHCTFDDYGNSIPVSQMYVKVGTSTPFTGGTGKIYYVSEAIVHENYDPVELNNDIALLKLKTPINFENAGSIELVSSIDIARGATDPGVMSTVTGWGLTSVNPETFPDVLQKVELPVVSNATAESVWRFEIPETFITAGYRNGSKDACNGDSGGPLVVLTDNGLKLAGIVSWGSTDCNTYGAYTRISSFEDWIRQKSGILAAYTPQAAAGDTVVCEYTGESYYEAAFNPDASLYEWSLEPVEAGNLSPSDNQASIGWNMDFLGTATVKYRVSIAGELSQWAVTDVNRVQRTRISQTPGDTAVCDKSSIGLMVNAEGHDVNYAYYHDNSFIGYYRNGFYWISFANSTYEGSYKVIAEGSCGSDESEPFNLEVIPVTNVNGISERQSVAWGEQALLAVEATGDDLHYQWEKDGTKLEAADSPEYQLAQAKASDTGIYTVQVSGSCGTERSEGSYLMVYPENSPDAAGIAVWPTVTAGPLEVAVSAEGEYRIVVYNAEGSRIAVMENCHDQTGLDLSRFGRGIFILAVQQGEISATFKVLVV
ncbi:MAG: trypsin-like serine protease [Bacteroidota bacterium]